MCEVDGLAGGGGGPGTGDDGEGLPVPYGGEVPDLARAEELDGADV